MPLPAATGLGAAPQGCRIALLGSSVGALAREPRTGESGARAPAAPGEDLVRHGRPPQATERVLSQPPTEPKPWNVRSRKRAIGPGRVRSIDALRASAIRIPKLRAAIAALVVALVS
ncbi:MAG TPA: hypothetical protein VK116_19540, partial [Planctomycetota bacterium]|nr:hypothetical protein [Planctomycetota bacterium]